MASIIWPREKFFYTGARDQPMPAMISLVGPARILFYGPYLTLPRGNWTARSTVVVGDNKAGNGLRIDVCIAGNVVAMGDAVLPAEGAFAVDLPFEVEDATTAIEIRFASTEGAIDGWFDLEQVELIRA